VTSEVRVTTLALAAEMRAKRNVAPFKLFEASGRDGALYREAMIHAGVLGPKVKSDDEFKPFAVCPICGDELEGNWP
jgi:hypothetical protein